MLAAEAVLRNPTVGIIGCCARAVSGHVAAPPRSVMNFADVSFDHLVGASLSTMRGMSRPRVLAVLRLIT